MLKRALTAGAVALVLIGALTAAGRWRDGRVVECGQRSTALARLDLLTHQPQGFTADPPAAGCDTDRVVAFASRQFTSVAGPDVDQLAGRVAAPVDQPAVTALYRHIWESAHWQISTREPVTGPNAALLCASKDLDFGTAHASLSFSTDNMYEVFVADSSDAGARCA